MTANCDIIELFATPLDPNWTVEQFAERLLAAIANRNDQREFVIDAAALTDPQSRRIFRPLLACLAIKAAAESGGSPNLYGGRLSFRRTSSGGPLWILGQFENKPGAARIALRRSTSPDNTGATPAPILADFPVTEASATVRLDPTPNPQ